MMKECIVCASTHIIPFLVGLLKCQTCGHVFADLDLDSSALAEMYSKNYFFGEEYSDYIADKKITQKNFRLRWNELKKFIDPSRHKSLLEIGCAYGFFLDVVKDNFACAQGIDISEDGVRYAGEELKLKVQLGDFVDKDFGDLKFDVVCMWDTIEHLMSPHDYIEKIGRHTDSGALLAITTGDIESLNARVKKDRWRLIHPPTHIHYFSRNSLAKLLDKHGFDVVYNRYCGFSRSMDNISYNIFVLRKKMPWVHNLLRKTGLTSLDFYLNLYDIMYLVARKR